MKKRHFLISKLAVVLVAVSCSLTMQAVNTITHDATYNFNNLTLGTDTLGGVTYATVKFGDIFTDGAPGTPSLPVDYIRFSVPWNATNFSVSASLRNSSTQNISYLVYPCQVPRMMNDTTPVTITLPDSAAYYSNSYYPAQSAWVVDEGFLAGENHIVTVAVMPISFKHTGTGDFTRNYLRKTQTVRLTLSYQLSDSLPMYPIVRQDTAMRNDGYQMTKNIVINPSSVVSYAPTQIDTSSLNYNLSGTGNDTIDRTNYPYLIITTPELKHSIRRIAALKRQKGLNVKVATINEVMSDPFASCGDVVNPFLIDNEGDTTFTDPAGKLRQYLRNAYIYNNTKYVLLAGTGIPYRSVNVNVHDPLSQKDTTYNVPSDLYFSDLSGDWSKEISIGLDRYIELNVGRILADNEEQITNYTDKLLRYELNPGKGDYEYLNRILFTTCHDLYDESEGVTTMTKRRYLSILVDSTDIAETVDFTYPSGEDIVNRINNRHFSFLSFMNYSSPSGIITCGYSERSLINAIKNYLWAIDTIRITENNQVYTLDTHTGNGLNNIENKWYPCIGYALGDATITIDQIPQFESINMGFGKSFTVGKDYGGPAFIGNTRKDIGLQSLYLQYSFARAFANANYKVGDAFNLSRSDRNPSDYTCLINNFLGDPEFQVWPMEYYMTHINPVQSITRTDNSIQFNPPSYGIITYCDNEAQTYGYYYNNTNLTSNSLLLARPYNNIPFILPLLLQNITFHKSQYIIASDVTAGRSIDNIRTNGDVTISDGIVYEIEASGIVTLEDGFKVEKGAFFAVYPSCF